MARVVQQLLRRSSCLIEQQRRRLTSSSAAPFSSSLPLDSLPQRPSDVRELAPSPSTFMELMAVPKRKVSRSRKGIRNGPKALKPFPVIIKCKTCGRVKLPHFFCCSGEKKAD